MPASNNLRAPNPVNPGGSTALVAIDNNEVQQPPCALNRMHASREKQIAFNKRVLRSEEEVSGINSGPSDFLNGLSMAIPTFVCLNVGELMTAIQPICGQLWVQQDRKIMMIHLLGLAPEGWLASPDNRA
jgi:hypothetical protein